jgi:ankyrin repeat protein
VNELLLTPGLLTTVVGRPNLSNETTVQYSILNILAGCCTSVSQVYFIDNVLTGIIILSGILICSPILSMLALFGAVTGQLSAAYLFGLSAEEIHKGLWGYNSVLTCQALGGMFFLLSGYRIWFFTLFGSIMTVVAQAAISIFFFPLGMSSLLLPSTLISWLFCLMAGSSKNMISVELPSMSIPEDHLRRFRLTRLVKMQLEFIQNLPIILQKTGRYEDMSMEDLAKIEAELVPILLCSYTHQNDIRNVKKLLHKGADINATDYDLRSPLHIAACDDNMELCFLFVTKFRANVNLLDDFDGTPLYDAFCHGNFNLIPFLYARGARMPDSKAKELTFYLCAFSFEGNLEAVQYLLACGVNPNLTDYDGRTALHLAVCGNHLPIVKYLVEIANASLSIVDYYGQTPVDDALDLPDTSIASYFQYERNSSLKQKRRKTIIRMEELLDDSDTENEEDDQEINEDLVDNSPSNVEEKLLPAMFCMAAAEGNIQQMASILQQFPDFRADSVDYDFRSAAHIAAAEGQLMSIRFLYDYCYSKNQDLHWLNKEDRWGCTPIEEAYHRGHYDIANYLKERIIKYSESVSIDIDENQSPMKKKVMNSMRKWKKVLYFATLASSNQSELIKGLLESGVFSPSEFYADYDGRTPMHLAAANGHFEVVKVLQYYGDTGRTHRDRWGNCAVDEAIRKKFDKIRDLLLEDIV